MEKYYIVIEQYHYELSKDVCLEVENTELDEIETLETNGQIESFTEVTEIVESYLKDYNIHSIIEKLYSDYGDTIDEVVYKLKDEVVYKSN